MLAVADVIGARENAAGATALAELNAITTEGSA
jgi:hypothetical protein